ncbi:MAG: sugar kinase [Gomphosphaeria aponina SAG 52.96 = DSM 107014]|uniref:Sugar kinase n=1 Tax=Gomphosphaeria aponina SAG 52.96 = DSM 107014 TaxID=1521640 RepID=A0A941JUD0_9CHRO|nr:sugar kinase [Gomphosphaeria aponina SAG 52.96 = DSM 107014]
MKNGLFVGLASLDLIYLTAKMPEPNQKIVALEQNIAAGGPATNAAVTFNFLGNQGKLLAMIGNHPISNLIKADLNKYNLEVEDLDKKSLNSPPVSSIIVTQGTGERAVISVNATKSQANAAQIPDNILQGMDLILVDGHQMAVSKHIAQEAKQKNIPVIMDGGSWKPGFEKVLPLIDYALCSANFYPPQCHTFEEVFAYLEKAGIPHIAITRGEKPIEYRSEGIRGKLEVTQIQAVDTLGAGDIFHGAFCHYLFDYDFIEALGAASKIATRACEFFGSRPQI